MRLGLLGGSFNPPHIGHLLLASDAFESLKLDRLVIMPACVNPLKSEDVTSATPEGRLEMTRLTFGGDARFEVSSLEITRGGLSYTVDTLQCLAAETPGAELFLLLGMDSFESLNRWKSPDRIRELATLAVLVRGEDFGHLPEGTAPVTTRRIDVSSSEIRKRVKSGVPISGFVTESVERYIRNSGLYAATAEG